MQKLITTVAALVIVLAMALNVLLLTQNQDLRQRLRTQPVAPAAPTNAPASADTAAELERYKKDFNKAVGEALKLREQNTSLSTAAQERDKLKTEVDTLKAENAQLKNEVQNLQTMNAISRQVSSLRGLTMQSTVPRAFMNQQELRAYYTKLYDTSYSADAEAADQAVLRGLDMGGEGQDGSLRQAQIDSLVKSVLGFYDQSSKQLFVITNRPIMGVHDRITYAHEWTHSLQDQHYNLSALFASAKGNADAERGLRALVEGDATMTMWLYAQRYLSAMDIANYKIEEFRSLDPNALLSAYSYDGPQVESATYFPYREGAAFVQLLHQQGGYAAVDRAFANPPRSTEQVLHPERYLAGDAPVDVSLPNLSAGLPGWKVAQENTLGELYLRIYLEHKLSFDEALPAAEGWGGDRYQVLTNSSGQVALALRTVWDTNADTDEFFATYADYVHELAGGTEQVVQSDGTRKRWQIDGRQILLARNGREVLVLQAPDGPTLDRLAGQF